HWNPSTKPQQHPPQPQPSPAAGDAPAGGLTTEMSPPPAVPAATPVSTPINLLDTCAVCKQSLQSRDCEPKLLPCLHSFCLKCIPQPDRQISVQVPGPHGQTDTHIVNVMRCSVCHQDYKQSDIIDNYFVKDTTEATSTSDEKAAQVCTSCEDNAGTIGFCVECGEWLCKTCVEAHQRVKITKDHKIRTKEDSVGASGQRPVFCPIHKQEPLKLFCETCDTLTCRDCQLLEHKEHRYQFLEEAFQNQKGIIETNMTKLQEKKNYVHYSVSQVQSRLKELNETHRKVEHEIKIAVFTLINEINKKGKSLLQQLESVTKERSMRLVAQHKDTTQLAQQIHHVLNFCHWAITTGSSTALLYSKRLILFQLRQVFKARLEPVPQANGAVRFFCDPTFWAKNVVNLGNLVIEKPPQPAHPSNMMVGGPPISPAAGHPGKHPGQINLAQLRLQHMQQAAYAQQKQQQQQQQQHQQQIQQQMRIASQMSQQHPRQAGPSMVQLQVWRTNSPLPVLGAVSTGQDALKALGERIKTEPKSETPCSGLNGSSTAASSSTITTTSSSAENSSGAAEPPLTNGNSDKRVETTEGGASAERGNSGEKEDDPNEDWCAVCINGGDLLCCDRCPKVFHMKCHVPTIKIFPKGDFLCTFCRSLSNPEIEYCDDTKKAKADQGMSPEDQRRCERLLLYIFCHELSVGFREPVPSSVPNYYKIIKQPMDLKKVKRKLQVRSSQHYQTTQDFVSDVRLVFKNCAKYNEAGSEMATSGKAVSVYFEEKLLEMFPGQSFPETPETESVDTEEKEEEEPTDDSEDDFIQPRRKRLKTDEKVILK
uniref:E3 ubiquitin-protein ligase TRIM33 n=1 Tax=Myripristis murdjan TaxID=586833 RepID=A0A668AFL8_9TELE